MIVVVFHVMKQAPAPFKDKIYATWNILLIIQFSLEAETLSKPATLKTTTVASVHHQQDVPTRQAIILLAMGWFLAHISVAMTPEHSATSGENSILNPQEQDTKGA